MKPIALTAIIALFAAGAAYACPEHPAPNPTAHFVNAAASGDRFEIESSKLALARSQDDGVRALATQLVRDHTTSSANLKTALAKSKPKVKPAPGMMPHHRKMLDALEGKQGEAFDDAYLDAQEDVHEEAVALFRDYAERGEHRTLKAFARKTLPTLEAHLEHIDELD